MTPRQILGGQGKALHVLSSNVLLDSKMSLPACGWFVTCIFLPPSSLIGPHRRSLASPHCQILWSVASCRCTPRSGNRLSLKGESLIRCCLCTVLCLKKRVFVSVKYLSFPLLQRIQGTSSEAESGAFSLHTELFKN